jgi:C4-dicarboxylate-specific signal transduction histidine kinase
VAPTFLVADARQLQRWGFSQASLPPGSTVLYRDLSTWARHWPWILAVLAVLAAQSLLIGSLLLERRRRVRAQQLVQEQAAYEEILAVLTSDSIRLTPEEIPRALEHALSRVARFAGADAAVLVADADGPEHPPTRIVWPAQVGNAGDPTSSTVARRGGSCLSVPIVAGEVVQGTLELYRRRGEEWPSAMAARLAAAADLMAGALARARAARALEESRGQIAHIARVATVGELAAAVTHDVRQPLAAIRFNAEAGAKLLADQPPRVAEARAVFADIVRADEMAFAVIDHIKGLLRRQEPTHGSVDLNLVCRQTARLLDHGLHERPVRLRLALDPELPAIGGDPVQLQQVLLNLTLNALEAVAASGRRGEVLVGTAARHGQVEVFVRDTGRGLSPELQRQIFEPFFSTKPNGLGMGLAIVRTIVQQHRGTVRAENAADGGAVLRVTLPMTQAASAVAPQGRRAGAEPASTDRPRVAARPR